MIFSLRGILTEKNPGLAIIECAGVGYGVKIPVSTYDHLPALNQEVKLLTVLSVGQDHQALYGFATRDEKSIFELLTTINGVGPALGLTILSGANPSSLRQMIVAEDEGMLKKIKGVGPKTAKRIIIELKTPLEGMSFGGSALPPAQQNVQDAQMALISLGYNRSSAIAAVSKALDELNDTGAAVDMLVKVALKKL